MRTSTTLWMAVMGLVSYHDSLFTMAQAAPAPAKPLARPRYYFPRHVKRQVGNLTLVDTAAILPSSSTSEFTSTEVILSTVFASADPTPVTPAAAASSTPPAVVSSTPPAVVSSTPPATASSSPPAAASSTPPAAASSSPPASLELPLPSSSIALVAASTGVVPDVVVPAASSSAPPPPSAAASSSPGVLDPLLGSTGLLTPSPSPAAATTQSPAAQSSEAPAIVPLVGGSTGLLPDTILQPSSSPAAATPAPSSSATGIIVGLGTIISVDPSAAPTLVSSPAAATTALSSGLTGAGTGVLPAVSTGASLPVAITDLSTALSAAPTGSPISIIPVASPSASLPVSGITGVSTGVSLSPTDIVSSAVPTLTGSGVSTTPGTETSTTPTLSVSPTSGPAATTTTAPTTTPTGTETTSPVSSSGLVSLVPTPSTTPVSTSAAIVPLIVSTPTTTLSIPNSIVPTGTDTMTIMTQPTSILVQSSVVGQSTTTAAGIPSSMPKVITPPGGNSQKPANTTLVQIGFTHELNYAFVSSNPASAGQIFSYLPQGVKWGLAIADSSPEAKDTRMYNLQPYDTSKTMGYITTLALMYISSDAVNQLAVDLHTPNSPLYNNPDPTIATLMSFINPTIPLIAGQPLDGTVPATSAPATTSAGAAGGAAPFGGDAQNSEKVKTSAVALGLPIAAGVVLYGAAMALVARRYRKRRGGHRRTSSLNSDPAWMSGARSGYSRNSRGSGSSQGRSIRTQQISAPVMAGNSLGWN